MPNFFKNFFTDVLIYSIGNFINKLTSFILLPLLTYVLTPKEYGLLSLILTTVSLFVVIFSRGLDNAATFYYYKTNNEKLRGQILYTKLWIRIILCSPIVIICLFSKYFSVLLFASKDYQLTIIIACILVITESFINEQKHLLRLVNKPKLFNYLNIGNAFIYLILTSVFLLVFKWNIRGILISGVLSGSVMFVYSLFYISKDYYDRHFKISIAKMLTIYGAPIILIAITNWLYQWSDKYLINYFAGLKDVGLYAVANTLSQPVIFINIAFQLSYLPFFWKSYNNDKSINKAESKLFVEKIFNIYFVIVCMIAIIISIFGKEITSLFTNHKYIDAYKAIVFLIFAYVLDYAKQLLIVGIFIHKKHKYNFLFILISLIVNLTLNFYFIPKYGFVGAAITTLIAAFINIALVYAYTQRLFKVNINIWSIAVFFITTLLMAFMFTILKTSWNIYILILFKILSIAICFVFAIILEIISWKDLLEVHNQIIKFIKSSLKKA